MLDQTMYDVFLLEFKNRIPFESVLHVFLAIPSNSNFVGLPLGFCERFLTNLDESFLPGEGMWSSWGVLAEPWIGHDIRLEWKTQLMGPCWNQLFAVPMPSANGCPLSSSTDHATIGEHWVGRSFLIHKLDEVLLWVRFWLWHPWFHNPWI